MSVILPPPTLEADMKEITGSLGRPMQRPKAPGPANGPVMPLQTILDRIANIRGKVADFDSEIRNEFADLDSELAALYVAISTKIGTR